MATGLGIGKREMEKCGVGTEWERENQFFFSFSLRLSFSVLLSVHFSGATLSHSGAESFLGQVENEALSRWRTEHSAKAVDEQGGGSLQLPPSRFSLGKHTQLAPKLCQIRLFFYPLNRDATRVFPIFQSEGSRLRSEEAEKRGKVKGKQGFAPALATCTFLAHCIYMTPPTPQKAEAELYAIC